MTPGCDEFAQTVRDLVSATSLEIPTPVRREHLTHCPSCRRRFRFLATAIQAAGADLQTQAVEDAGELLTCEECEDLLPNYLYSTILSDSSASERIAKPSGSY